MEKIILILNYFEQAEAELAPAVGRIRGGVEGAEAPLQRAAVVDDRPENGDDGGGLRRLRRRGVLPDRGLLRLPEMHGAQRRQAGGGGDSPESGRMRQCRARERRFPPFREARFRQRFCDGIDPYP